MKSFVKYAGIIALCFTVLGFILMMATPSMTLGGGFDASGIEGIFKEGAPWSGLVAWIFTLLAIIALALVVLLPLFKVNALEKYSKIIYIVAAVLAVVAGVFTFLEATIFNAENTIMGISPGVKLGAGWIVTGILLILSGICSVLPAVVKSDN